MSKNKNKKQAFTIVELMLAVAFLGTMLVSIAALTVRIVNIYQKGLSMRAVNSVGRAMMSDLSSYIGGSKLGTSTDKDINPKADASTLDVTFDDIAEARAKYFFAKHNGDGVQEYGAFCTGDYVYVWNTAKTLTNYMADNSKPAITVKIGGTGGGKIVAPRFGRIDLAQITSTNIFTDAQAEGIAKEFAPCALLNSTDTDLAYKDLEVSDEKYFTEIIADNEADIAVYDFVVQHGVRSNVTGHALYEISYVIATRTGGVNVNQSSNFCRGTDSPDLSEYDRLGLNYCSVNKFDIVVQQSSNTSVIRDY